MLLEHLPPEVIDAAVAASIADAIARHADTCPDARLYSIYDDACYEAGLRLLHAVFEALPVAGVRLPCNYMERAARPYVIAALEARGETELCEYVATLPEPMRSAIVRA